MTANQQKPDDDEFIGLYILRIAQTHARRLVLTAGLVAGVVALIAGVYLIWGQPTVRSATLQFRPTFSGAADGLYPNQLPFSPSDITAPSVIDAVFDKNNIKEFCSREDFRSAIYVDQHSMAYAALDAEYEARLTDPALSGVQRAQLQEEYETRRAALPLGLRLVFLVPAACDQLPGTAVSKVLADVLSTWAEESETRRGVLNVRVQVLTPNVLDVGLSDAPSRLIRADLIRTALRRLVDNVREVEKLPGAQLVRFGERKVSFAEVRAQFQDLIQARLEPLVIAAGRGMGRDSAGWVEQALTAARHEQLAAEGRARAYLDALREYSGVAQTVDGRQQASGQTGSSDVQTLTPQIDSTFIDRIIDMSAENIAFRQSMTRSMVLANVEAVDSRAKVSYYENLSSSMQQPSSMSLPGEEVDTRLAGIVADGKALAAEFNGLYEEFSRVSLRPQAGLYQTEQPAQSAVEREFSLRDYVLTVLGAFVVAWLLTLAAFLVRSRMRPAPARA